MIVPTCSPAKAFMAVLLGLRGGERAGRQAEVERDAEDMARADPRARRGQHAMVARAHHARDAGGRDRQPRRQLDRAQLPVSRGDVGRVQHGGVAAAGEQQAETSSTVYACATTFASTCAEKPGGGLARGDATYEVARVRVVEAQRAGRSLPGRRTPAAASRRRTPAASPSAAPIRPRAPAAERRRWRSTPAPAHRAAARGGRVPRARTARSPRRSARAGGPPRASAP